VSLLLRHRGCNVPRPRATELSTSTALTEHSTADGQPRGRYLALLSLSALGVVYGDIGTSVLYAMRESFHHAHGIDVDPANVLGVLSLIFWALVLVI